MINTFRTLFEARERKFQQERLFRGESVDLVAKITTDGVLDTLSGYSISGVYQPTDDLSGDIYPVDAEIVDGNAVLHWTNDNDFGKDSYNVWGLLTKDGKAAYPICWRLMFAHSPSYPLGTPDPIPRTIDFSQYELLNAPWLPLSGGVLSGRIYYDIEEPVQITNLSSWIGDATGLGRGIITIYNETENTLDDKYSQEGATLSGRWDNMWNPPNPTGPLVFPENPSEGDVFEPYAAMDGEYLNGKDVTFSKGTVLIANPGWETKEVPCFYIHVVYTYIYHVGEGWVPRTENDWCICKINGEWQAASFARGFTAYDSLVWHEFSEGGTEPREPDPFVLSSEIADFATKQYVQEAIASIPTPEVADFATYDYVDQKFETKVHADETKIELDSKIATKVSKEELSAELSDYATVSFVNDSFNNARTYTDEQIDWLSNVYTKTEDLSATYETKQHAADTYHTKADAVADSTYLNGRIDAVSAAISSIEVEGDYLPLSGGNLSGRIYLVETEDPAISVCIFQGETQTWNRYIETWETEVNFSITSRLSVYDAGQEFIDMLMNSEEFSEEVLTTKNVSVEVSISETDTLQESWTLTASGQVGFGNSYAAFAALHLGLDIENDGVLIIDAFAFDDSTTSGYAPLNPGIWIYATVEGVADTPICEELLNDVSKWTIEEIGGTGGRNANDPFVLSSELSDYYTKTEADGKFLTAHQSLEDYYTKQEADGKFLTAHQDLTDYATKEFVQSEISDFITEDALTGLATKQELSDAIGDIDTILDFINGQTI